MPFNRGNIMTKGGGHNTKYYDHVSTPHGQNKVADNKGVNIYIYSK